MKTIRRKEVLKTLLKLYGELGRPVHLADLKKELRILTKRDTTRRTHTESDALARALQRLFDEGKISKSRELVRVERYPVSPYAKTMKQTTANVRFYAPIECAGKRISFELNGESYELDFIGCERSQPYYLLTSYRMKLPQFPTTFNLKGVHQSYLH